MKKIFITLILSLTIFSCKTASKFANEQISKNIPRRAAFIENAQIENNILEFELFNNTKKEIKNFQIFLKISSTGESENQTENFSNSNNDDFFESENQFTNSSTFDNENNFMNFEKSIFINQQIAQKDSDIIKINLCDFEDFAFYIEENLQNENFSQTENLFRIEKIYCAKIQFSDETIWTDKYGTWSIY